MNERFGSLLGHPDNVFRKLDDRITDMELEARSLLSLRSAHWSRSGFSASRSVRSSASSSRSS